MNKSKFSDKLKEGISVQEIEGFARKHTTEVFSVLALLIAAVSSIFDFFTGAGMTITFLTVGTILAIFFPAPAEKGLKQLYHFTYKQEKTTEIILGSVKIVVAIFLPFLYFGLVGLLAGTSFHYYIRHAQVATGGNHKGYTGKEHE